MPGEAIRFWIRLNPYGIILVVIIALLSCGGAYRPDNPIALDTIWATRVDGCRHWSYRYGYSVNERLDSLVYHDTYDSRSPKPMRFLPEGYICLDTVKVYEDEDRKRCFLGYKYSNWREQ